MGVSYLNSQNSKIPGEGNLSGCSRVLSYSSATSQAHFITQRNNGHNEYCSLIYIYICVCVCVCAGHLVVLGLSF